MPRKAKKVKADIKPPKKVTPQPLAQSRKYVQPKNEAQKTFLRAICENDIVFGIGAAGSGKTHISVGFAINSMLDGKFERIILTRPILESGEKLGALPGDLLEKTNPYMVPFFDELKRFASHTEIALAKNGGKIEIAPLAYMRGRTFRDCIVIADEMSNASFEQIRMLLTRIGENSKMIVLGDPLQSDLPTHQRGALARIAELLEDVDGICAVKFNESDIVRHGLIATILDKLKLG